jgi:RNA polymerase sigma factor (sigma-70 family)
MKPFEPQVLHALSRPPLRDEPRRAPRESFGASLEAMMPGLRGFARKLCRDADFAEDLVQDAVLRAWRARDSFVEGTNFRAWTFTILRNAFLSETRRDRLRTTVPLGEEAAMSSVPATQEAAIHLSDLSKVLDTLPFERRQAVMLVAVEGLSYEEAAVRCDCPIGTIKSRVARARATISEQLMAEPQFQA